MNTPDRYATQWVVHRERGVLALNNGRLIMNGVEITDLASPVLLYAHYESKEAAGEAWTERTFIDAEPTKFYGPPWEYRD